MEQAVARALEEFRTTREESPMGAHVLRIGADETVVRVMYLTDQIPPGRAWYAVARTGSVIRELSFADVEDLEGPWR
jgi:hypothetical protein